MPAEARTYFFTPAGRIWGRTFRTPALLFKFVSPGSSIRWLHSWFDPLLLWVATSCCYHRKDCFDVGVTENHKLYIHFKRGFKYFWIFLQGITLFPTLQHNIGAMFATFSSIGTRIRSIDWPENNHTVCSQSEKSKQQQNLGKYMHNTETKATILHYEGEMNTIQTG